MKSIPYDILIDCSVIYPGNHTDKMQQMLQFAIETTICCYIVVIHQLNTID